MVYVYCVSLYMCFHIKFKRFYFFISVKMDNDKGWIYTTEYYSAINKNKIMESYNGGGNILTSNIKPPSKLPVPEWVTFC